MIGHEPGCSPAALHQQPIVGADGSEQGLFNEIVPPRA